MANSIQSWEIDVTLEDLVEMFWLVKILLSGSTFFQKIQNDGFIQGNID